MGASFVTVQRRPFTNAEEKTRIVLCCWPGIEFISINSESSKCTDKYTHSYRCDCVLIYMCIYMQTHLFHSVDLDE